MSESSREGRSSTQESTSDAETRSTVLPAGSEQEGMTANVAPSFRAWSGWLTAHLRQRKSLVAFVVGALVFVGLYMSVNPTPVMIIDAQSRSLEYSVVNPDWASILFQDVAVVRKTVRDKPQCIQGVLEPFVTSTVRYSVSGALLIVRIINKDDPYAGQFHPAEGSDAPIKLPSGASIFYGPNPVCDSSSVGPIRLPIWGPAKLGQTPLPWPKAHAGQVDPLGEILLGGTVQVFGRKTFGRGIYHAGEVVLPAGSQLSSEDPRHAATEAPWWGYALFDAKAADHGEPLVLHISASTESDALILKRLAAGQSHEKIEVGLLTEIFGDPLFASITLLIGGLFAWAQMVSLAKEFIAGKHS